MGCTGYIRKALEKGDLDKQAAVCKETQNALIFGMCPSGWQVHTSLQAATQTISKERRLQEGDMACALQRNARVLTKRTGGSNNQVLLTCFERLCMSHIEVHAIRL
jgi:hypothetical protein